MKKLSILLVVLVMVITTSVSVYAANPYTHKELYSIELPDGYEYFEDMSTEEIPIFVKDNSSANININYVKNTENETLKNLSSEYIENYKETYKNYVLAEYAKQGETSAELNIIAVEEKELSNGYTSLLTIVETKLSNGVLYQKMYQFAGVEYVYTITITSQNKKQLTELDNVIETFKMNEEELLPTENAVTPDTSDVTTDGATPEEESSGSVISIIIFAGFIIAIIVVIIINNKKQKKKQEEQLTAPIQSIFDTQQSKQIQDELSNYNNNKFQ